MSWNTCKKFQDFWMILRNDNWNRTEIPMEVNGRQHASLFFSIHLYIDGITEEVEWQELQELYCLGHHLDWSKIVGFPQAWQMLFLLINCIKSLLFPRTYRPIVSAIESIPWGRCIGEALPNMTGDSTSVGLRTSCKLIVNRSILKIRGDLRK